MTLANTPPKAQTPAEFLGTDDLGEQLERIATAGWRVPVSIVERVCAAAATGIRRYEAMLAHPANSDDCPPHGLPRPEVDA